MKSILTFLCLLFLSGTINAQTGSSYLFAYFSADDQASGLKFAYSSDGLKWESVANGKSFLIPEIGNQKIMRDPSITQGPDGTFHLVWTCSWADRGIGYTSSRDLIHWSEQQYIPVMTDTATVYCWAPEIFYDKASKSYYIIWSSTVKGKHNPIPHTPEEAYNNPRLYYTTTKDFNTFTPAQKFYDKGFAVIDGFLLKEKNRYYLFLKNENSLPPQKNIRIATASRIEGPYSEPGEALTNNTYWAEGAACLKVDDLFYLYYDKYKNSVGYGAKVSKDLINWLDATSDLIVPKDMKHGTPIPISENILKSLLKK